MDRISVSEYFGLQRSQAELDFVDVDVAGDVRVFIDPTALRLMSTTWSHECVSLLQSFFETVLDCIRGGDESRGKRLLGQLREPNETHLGLSKQESRGRALGPESADDVWDALSESRAVATGLLEDLEDTILTVPGIRNDIVSDITTNVIRGPLIEYTQAACGEYDIPLVPNVYSGPLWDPHGSDWDQDLVSLPMAPGRLLLVPKVIVRRKLTYDVNDYVNRHVIPYLQTEELRVNSELVQLLKNGTARVTKKSIRAKYGSGKKLAIDQTLQNPRLLEIYRRVKRQTRSEPLDHESLAEAADIPEPDWEGILQKVLSVGRGKAGADKYHRAAENLLTALFYPDLTSPVHEFEIHEGRKRIDIVYQDTAVRGFFAWLAQHYNAPYVVVECKNYTGDPKNPELDQISGRFSHTRGEVGILICRELTDRKKFMKSCRDTASDGRGFVVPLDDSDLKTLTEMRKTHDRRAMSGHLKELFDTVVS
jgi:hypothetical protein